MFLPRSWARDAVGAVTPAPTMSYIVPPYGVSATVIVPPLVSPTMTPTVAPTVAPTMTPTVTPTMTPMIYTYAYSYYYPALGGVNCHPDNWDGDTCADITASGVPWSAWLGRGVAIPYSLVDYLPYGSVIRVLSPVEIAGDYTVVDLCPLCDHPSGARYLDFLDTAQRLPWGTPVDVVFHTP